MNEPKLTARFSANPRRHLADGVLGFDYLHIIDPEVRESQEYEGRGSEIVWGEVCVVEK
jgi:hypothetical protein